VNPGDVILISLPLFGGGTPKLRPALLLANFPGPYQNLLICGISTQLHLQEPNWDELVQPSDADFISSGLRHPSLIRLSYLYAADASEITGTIGFVDPSRNKQLCVRLSDHLRP
jgi:mRNA interferase MazF